MKRDLDLLRELLLEIEQRGPGMHAGASFSGENRISDEVAWHLALLSDAKFILASPDSAAFTWEHIRRPRLETMMIYRLTHEGCDYLDSVREPERWASVKTQIKGQVTSAPLDIVKALAVATIKDALGL